MGSPATSSFYSLPPLPATHVLYLLTLHSDCGYTWGRDVEMADSELKLRPRTIGAIASSSDLGLLVREEAFPSKPKLGRASLQRIF